MSQRDRSIHNGLWRLLLITHHMQKPHKAGARQLFSALVWVRACEASSESERHHGDIHGMARQCKLVDQDALHFYKQFLNVLGPQQSLHRPTISPQPEIEGCSQQWIAFS